MTESRTEKQSDQETKEKTIAQWLLEAFDKIQQKISEILRIEERKRTREQKELLTALERETAGRRHRYKETPFAQATETLITQIKQDLDQIRRDLEAAPPAQKKQKNQEAIRRFEELRDQAAAQIAKEPADLEEKLKRIAHYDLDHVLERGRIGLNEAILAHGGEEQIARDARIRGESEIRPAGQKLPNREALKRYMMEQEGLSEDEAEEAIRQVERREGQVMGIREYYDEEQKRILMDPSDRGKKARQKEFDDFYQFIDNFPDIFSDQAMRYMGLDMLNKWSNYIHILNEIPGDEKQKILNEFSANDRLRRILHDGKAVVEQGVAKPEQFQEMMERVTPNLFDQLFHEREAELAAHLYEVGMTQIRAKNENWVPTAEVMYGPKERESKLDIWVRERFKEILKAKYGAENVGENKEWDDQRIQKVLALGKGYEFIVLRMPEIVAGGRHPKGTVERGVVVSPPYEDFVRPLDPFEYLLEKFEGYEDPGMHFLLFLMTGDTELKWSTREELDKLLKQKFNVDPKGLRLIDMVNWIGIGGPWSATGWRRDMITRGFSDEQKKWLGLAFRISEIDSDRQLDSAEKTKKKKEELLFTLKRNPLRILREAELQDGEIFDPEVSKKVLQKFADKRHISLDQAKETQERTENNLVLLAQLEADSKKGRKGKIDFNHLQDERQRAEAQAYYEAIKEVMTGKVDWQVAGLDERGKEIKEIRSWEDKKADDSLLDFLAQKKFPFAPGLEDTPWSELPFVEMGQKGFSRRMRDYVGAEKTMIALIHLGEDFAKLQKPEDIVKMVDDVWKGIRLITKSGARDKMVHIYEGIARMNAGNSWKRYLPVPLDSLPDILADTFGDALEKIGIRIKPTSYAKEKFGDTARSYRAIDLYNFLKYARQAGHITEEHEKELRRKLKCHLGYVITEVVCRVTPIGLVAGAVLATKAIIDQLKEELEKEAEEV